MSEACEITCTLDPPWVEKPQMMMKKEDGSQLLASAVAEKGWRRLQPRFIRISGTF